MPKDTGGGPTAPLTTKPPPKPKASPKPTSGDDLATAQREGNAPLTGTMTRQRESFAAPKVYQAEPDFRHLAPPIIFQDTTQKIGPEDTDPAWLNTLNGRANAMDPAFVAAHPDQAAALLTSAVPTKDLTRVSRKYNEALGWAAQQLTVEGVPYFLQDYYRMAFNAPSPDRRAQALAFLDTVREQPPGVMLSFLHQHSTEFDKLVADHTAGQVAVSVTGGLLAAPIVGAAELAKGGLVVAGAGLDTGLSAAGAEGFGEQIRSGLNTAGGVVGKAPEFMGKATRLAYGTALAAGTTFAGGGPKGYSPQEAFMRYAWNPSFGDAQGMGPMARLFFDTTGLDPEKYEGLSSVVDFGGDMVGGFAIFRGAATLNHMRRTPAAMGGSKPGSIWVEKTRAGRKLVDIVDEVRVAALNRGDNPVAYLIDNTSKKMPVALAEEVMRAGSKAEVKRTIANYADDTVKPSDLTAVQRELKDIHKQLGDAQKGAPPTPARITSQAQVVSRYDDTPGDYVYHAAPEEVGLNIWDEGIKASTPKLRPEQGDGVYFTEKPHAYPFMEDAPKNLYRVRRDRIDDLRRSSDDDVWTPRDILPEEVEVYVGEGRWEPLKGGNPVLETDLLARRAAAEQRLADLNGRMDNPLWEWPEVLRIKPIIMDAPVNSFQRVLANLYKPVAKTKVLDVRSFINDMSPREQIVYGPHQARTNPPGFMQHNFKVLRNNWRIMRVPESTQRMLLGDLLKVRTGHQMKLWADNVKKVEARALGEKRMKLVAEARDVTKYSERSAEDATRVPYELEAPTGDGIVIRERHNVLESEDGWPQPVLEADFMGHLELANIETLRAASSNLRYMDQWARSKPYWGKLYGSLSTTVGGARFVAFTVPRLIMKPLLFVTRPLILGGKVQFDQGLRASVMGMKPLAIWSRRHVDFLPDGTPIKSGVRIQDLLPPSERPGAKISKRTELPEGELTLLGTLRETGVYEGPAVRTSVPTRHLDPNRHTAEIAEVADGMYDQLMHYRNSALARLVASRGAEGALRYIDENPQSSVAQFTRGDLAESMANSGVDLPTTLARIEQAIDLATGKRPDLRRTISTGRWNRDEARSGPTASERELAVRVQELDNILAREEQARLNGDNVELVELARRHEEVRGLISSLERKASKEAPGLDFGNKQSITAALREEHANGAYRFPDRVQVAKKAKKYDDHITGGKLGKVHEQFARMSDWLYRGLKPVSWADAQLTRGSMYFQLLEKNTKKLVSRGYSQESAFRIAQYRAAFQVRDLMYDLSARSSFDRAVKDVFWFAPVLREQLTTWLYKIPAEATWPVGITALAGTTSNLLDDFRELGWARDITNEDGSTETVVKLPFISDMLGKFQGAPVEMRLDSLNPITPGGSTVVPTLPPGAEAILDFSTRKAPESLKPFLKTISQTFSFDHGEVGTNWLPTGINGFLQILGVNAPFKDQWNPTMWERADRQAHTQAMQFAMSDLRKEGIMAPAPGAPADEWDRYRDMVEAGAADYEGGLQLMRFVSYVLSPMSITATPPVQEKFVLWKKSQGIEYPYKPGDFEKIEEYVRKHPEALPYTIGRYGQSDDPILAEDAPIAEKLYVGDIWPLTSDEYWVKAMTTMGFAAEEQRLRSELRAVGLTDPGERLRNWDKYSEVQAQHLIRLDQWFTANPEVENYLNTRGELTAREEALLETSRNLKILEGYGVLDDVGSSELGAVRAALTQAMQDIAFGPPETEEERVIAHYFNNVYEPYREEIDPLYDRVEVLFASGQDGAAYKVLDHIREVNNSYTDVEFAGSSLPSPEEFQFNNKPAKQRKIQVLDWTLSNPQNLSDFQLRQVGVPNFKGREVLAQSLSNIDDRIYEALANPSLSDAQREALYLARERDRQRVAFAFGAPGIRFERVSAMTPSDRLTATGFGKGSLYWNIAVGEAQNIVRFANSKGVSPKYASESSGLLSRKIEFERRLNFWRAIDPEFDRLWRQLSQAAADHGEEFKLGVRLYEHVFFGQAQNAYNYQDPLVAAVERTP